MYSTLILLLIFSSPQEFRCCCHLSPAPPIQLSIKICKIINPKSTPLLLLLLTWTPKPRWQGNNVSDNIILVPLGLGENSSCHDDVDVDKNRSVQTPASTHHVGYTAAPTSGSPSVPCSLASSSVPSPLSAFQGSRRRDQSLVASSRIPLMMILESFLCQTSRYRWSTKLLQYQLSTINYQPWS